ncbi:MAG: hypothetical protein ABDH37_03070 [Candidatus Hydrothermales bacterium]
MICPECGSMKIEEIEKGYFYCLECGHEFSEEEEYIDESDYEDAVLEDEEEEEEFYDYDEEEEEEEEF